MKYSNSEISFYVDTMIVETLLTDSHLVKNAQTGGIVSGLVEKVKEYFAGHFDSNDKAGSVINMLAPGAVAIAFSAMGIPWIGPLLALAMNVFHVDVKGILTDIWNGVKGFVSSGKQTNSEQIDGLVDSTISNHVKPATQEEAEKSQSLLQKKDSAHLLREARLLKYALIAYDADPENFIKQAGLFEWFAGKKAGTGSLLGLVLKWLFKIVLASAGFMVAGDVVNKFLGRDNALDGTLHAGKPTSTPTNSVAVPKVISKQTRFPVNPGYQDAPRQGDWTETVQNSESSISNMVVGWAKEVYQGLGNLDNVIRATAGFQTAVEAIVWHNHATPNATGIYIPPMFTSKKMVVDHFIDDVAEKAPK